MKVTITTPARFPAAFAAAHYHDERGQLGRIVSPVPASRSERYGVTRARVDGIAALGAWNHGFQRFAPRRFARLHQATFSATFDEIASRRIGACDVVNAWQSTALRTIRAAHRQGIPSVLEVASAHILMQEAILRDQFSTYGADIDRAVISPAVIRRVIAEYREADRIIATSSFVRDSLVKHGVDAAKIAVVPYGIDPAPTPLRREHRDPPRVLFVGGVTLRKGIPYLFDAFRRVEAHATLRIVGQVHPRLLARLGGPPPRTQIAGARDGNALANEYAHADIFVLPSVEDGFGLVTLEAMRAGLPVIVSDHAGSAEVVEEGVTGFVVPAKDVAALASRIELLARDAALRRRMGAAARVAASARTWQTYGDERHALVYAPLLGMDSSEREVQRAAAA
jgi:glycosyltransferase involved in cell wall biosynthesis